MKKGIIILLGLCCILVFVGVVSATNDNETLSMTTLQDAGSGKIGYIQLNCNAQNVTAIFTEYVHGFYVSRVVELDNNYPAPVNIDMPVTSINISAPGYFSQNITEIQMPQYNQCVNITVTLTPIPSTPVSSVPFTSIFCSFVLSLFIFGRRHK